ncbi:MAG: hypothetical protein IT242_10150 [Bacteroidia bacterium]|nr:hypothetical protein [Bacteroidia bacterium]
MSKIDKKVVTDSYEGRYFTTIVDESKPLPCGSRNVRITGTYFNIQPEDFGSRYSSFRGFLSVVQHCILHVMYIHQV